MGENHGGARYREANQRRVVEESRLIPDGWIGRFLLDAPFNSQPNRLDDCETFVEFKTLASLAMAPNARAQQVQADTEQRAQDLDLKYPGSTFTQVSR